ncbi:hypothetical protein [Streptomyces sp. NPDC002521]
MLRLTTGMSWPSTWTALVTATPESQVPGPQLPGLRWAVMDRNGHSRLRIPRTVPHPPDPGHKPGGGINNKKDPVETRLHTAVCSGKVTLAAAQKGIATDWTTAEKTLGLS